MNIRFVRGSLCDRIVKKENCTIMISGKIRPVIQKVIINNTIVT